MTDADHTLPCDQCEGAPEVWAAIPGHPYEASTHGRVRNARNGHVLAPCGHTRGYRKVHLGVARQITVHRAVALAHLPLPHGGDLFTAWDVDHRDFTRTHNHLSNLRWMPADKNRRRYLRDAIAADEAAEQETPPMTPDELAAYEASLADGGW